MKRRSPVEVGPPAPFGSDGNWTLACSRLESRCRGNQTSAKSAPLLRDAHLSRTRAGFLPPEGRPGDAVKLTGQRYQRLAVAQDLHSNTAFCFTGARRFFVVLGRNVMASAIELIAQGFVRVKDRAALERMREHRGKLLNDYRMGSAGFRSEVLETTLQDDLAVLDAALSRLQAPAE
jgi:hypothetical protein